MKHLFEVHAFVPHVGHVGIRILAISSFEAQQALLAMYPSASSGTPTGFHSPARQRMSGCWLSGIIVIASAAVVWSVFVVPAGFAGIPGLAELAAAIAAGTGDTMTNFLDVLSIEIVFAYTMRILGLATLLYLLTVTTAEAWGMAILGREADRDVPREGMMRFGARLAAIFPVTLSRMLAFTVMLAIAIALIHPASLGWFLSLMPSH